MAKDDYFVIVYQILGYLYAQLKTGKKIDSNMIKHDGIMFNIEYSYWCYIMIHLLKDDYIEGITFNDSGETKLVLGLDQCQITPKGIYYLTENSKFKKVVKVLKEIKGFIPFELI